MGAIYYTRVIRAHTQNHVMVVVSPLVMQTRQAKARSRYKCLLLHRSSLSRAEIPI
jgi:hypothetical protein